MKIILLLVLLVLLKNSQQIDVNQIDLKLQSIDSSLADIQWCGETVSDIPIVLTQKGSIYRSTDKGLTWTKMTDIFQRLGYLEVDKNQKVGVVMKMIISKADPNIVIFLGSDGINWITQDCAKSILAMNHGRQINEFQFHPTEKNWLLAAAWNKCDDFDEGEPCEIYKEIFLSRDLGNNWELLQTYVVQFSWGMIEPSFTDVPKERIILAHEPLGKGHQKTQGWNDDVHLVYSDDFFKTNKMLIQSGNKFLISKTFFFVAKVLNEETQDVQLLVSDPNNLQYSFKETELPFKRFKDHSYTILDMSEEQVFLNVNHYGSKAKYGNIYISDSAGIRFSSSLQHAVRGFEGQCDFEKLHSLEGIYIANTFDEKKIELTRGADSSLTAYETMTQKQKDKAQLHFEQLDSFKKSVITFDKGSIWKPIIAPEVDSLGKKIYCQDSDCSLHVNSVNSRKFGPVYSTPKAIGIFIATGNVGKYLSTRPDEINTYLSRDGGLTWFEIAKGSHIYEMGDHGGLLVMCSDQEKTNKLIFSWDEGASWEELEFSQAKIQVQNIIIESKNVATTFILYGEDHNGNGVIVGIDFASLHKKQCQGVENAGLEESDFEKWSPSDTIKGHRCLMGHITTYVRRKKEAQCFNGEDLEREVAYQHCACSEQDWECDFGFQRSGDGPCVSIDKTKTEIDYKAPEICKDYYYVSNGYRKVAGNTCDKDLGGIDHSPLEIPCPGKYFKLKIMNKNNVYMLIIICLLIIILVFGGKNQVIEQIRNKLYNVHDKRYVGIGGQQDVDFGQMVFDDNFDENAVDVFQDNQNNEEGQELGEFNPRS